MSGMYLSATAIIDDVTEIRASLDGIAALYLAGEGTGGHLSIQPANGTVDPVAVADRLLAAVTEWRDEIARRAT